VAELAERFASVTSAIDDAVREAGRTRSDLTTVVVTKFHPASLVRELVELGVRDFGESRHQEAMAKAVELRELDPRWHFVGQLQSKKARQAREYARVVHSLDRASLVTALGADSGSVDAFVQINLTDDEGRGGVAPSALAGFVDDVLATPGIRLLGLMTVAPLGEPARPAFARLRELSEGVRTQAPDAVFLSMGMSGDYREAILEGATHLRIGTAITGNRPLQR
jgi:pyridoxal phosphate enzyme (YggS family)